MGLAQGEAYSSYFPTWEVTAPQYIQPNAWTLTGYYKTNEVAYACIDLWMKTASEPSLRVWDKKKEQFVDDHPLYEFMAQPCPDLSETDFWNATVMYLKIAGFMGWEKDHANDGSLLNVWPMMPQYCSFMRGEKQLLRAVRYQPYTGLPYLDIPRERIVFFSYMDPQYFGLRPFSPTAVIADILGLDNNMTKMVDNFVKNGAFLGGLLKTEQTIQEADARFARERWQEQHGGPANAGQIAVLGKGMEFQATSTTNREFMFPDVDARSETRICMAYAVKPILVSAKVGMDRSTMNNYKEGKASWYEEEVTSEWKFLAERATRDLLREFDDDPNHVCRFDISEIKALQEDRSATFKRATEAYEKRIITRNTALKEMGLDPLGDSDPMGMEYYQTVMSQSSTTDNLDVKDNSEAPEAPKGAQVETPQPPTDEQKTDEKKKFRAYAKRRLKEGKAADIPEYEFKYLDEAEQRQIKSEYGVPDPDAAMILSALMNVVEAINKPQVIEVKSMVDMPAAQVTVNVPEQKAPKLPAPVVNVNVEPTPISVNVPESPAPQVTVTNELKTPKVKRTTSKVARDGNFNIGGQTVDYEYEE